MRLALAAVVAIGCSSSATTNAPPSPGSGSTTPRPPASLRDRVLAINGHVTVLKSQATFAEYRDVVRSAMQIKGVMSAEPFVFSDMTATSPGATAPVKIVVKGIDPAGVTKAAISSFLRAGTLDFAAISEPPPTVVLADGLATSLGAKVGDQITITVDRETVDLSTWNPQSNPHPQMVRVGGIIHT
jgi:ABC-type lipoprotein release transport system permease subunit